MQQGSQPPSTPTTALTGTNGAQSDQSQHDQSTEIDKTKLIVNYIPQFATEEDLAALFGPIGKIESIKIMRDYKTGYSFGFGFVKYFAIEDAAKAIEMLNGMNYKNKRLKVSYSRPPAADMKDSNLYITNLPKDVTEQDVHNLFCNYGEIVQKSVLKDKITGLPRGVAFVRFSKGEEAQAAIANLDGKLLENAMFPLSVRVAEDHGRQKAQYLDSWGMSMYNRAGRGVGVGPSTSIQTTSTTSLHRKYGNYNNNNNNNNHHQNGRYYHTNHHHNNNNNYYHHNSNNIRYMDGVGDNYHLPFYC